MHWSDTYPHEVNASVLLLDGKIYNWKIGNQWWHDPLMVKMRFSDMEYSREERFTVQNKSFTVNNDEEHNEAFATVARDWFKQFEISEHHIGGTPY